MNRPRFPSRGVADRARPVQAVNAAPPSGCSVGDPSTYAQVMVDIRSGRARGNGARSVSKFKNVRCEIEVDGRLERFDSKAERDRYLMLRILQRSGAISDLERQVTIDLQINGKTVRQMRWDFAYTENHMLILDDTKGAPATEGWLIKASFLMALRPELELRVNGKRLKS